MQPADLSLAQTKAFSEYNIRLAAQLGSRSRLAVVGCMYNNINPRVTSQIQLFGGDIMRGLVAETEAALSRAPALAAAL